MCFSLYGLHLMKFPLHCTSSKIQHTLLSTQQSPKESIQQSSAQDDTGSENLLSLAFFLLTFPPPIVPVNQQLVADIFTKPLSPAFILHFLLKESWLPDSVCQCDKNLAVHTHTLLLFILVFPLQRGGRHCGIFCSFAV